MTTNEAIAGNRDAAGAPIEPIGEAKHGGVAASGRSSPGAQSPERPGDDPGGRARPLRIGDRVRSLVDDVFVDVGLTGLVVNVAPPRYGAPARARILWDNETVSMTDASTFEVIGGPDTAETADGPKVA